MHYIPGVFTGWVLMPGPVPGFGDNFLNWGDAVFDRGAANFMGCVFRLNHVLKILEKMFGALLGQF